MRHTSAKLVEFLTDIYVDQPVTNPNIHLHVIPPTLPG